MLGYVNVVLCGLCDTFDLLLFFFLLLPKITRATKLLALGMAVAAGLLVSLIAAFVREPIAQCPWCSQHYPINAIGWVYLAQAVLMLGCVALAHWRPWRAWSPRPATVVYGLFWVPIYLATGIVLPLMQRGYPDGAAIDWGFCVLGLVVFYYYVLLVPVQYLTITRDSKYVLQNGLDDATATAKEVRNCSLWSSF